MRLIFTLTLCCLMVSDLTAQSDKEDIVSSSLTYFGLLGEQKISEALDHVHPDLINMLGKETFENQYKQLFNAPGMEVSMSEFSVDTVSDIHEASEIRYSLVDYSFLMQFVVDLSDDKEGNLHPFLLGTYKRQFGEENVTSDTAGTYDIRVIREMFSVQDPKFEGWKILDFEEGMRVFLVGIIPEEVLKHFNR